MAHKITEADKVKRLTNDHDSQIFYCCWVPPPPNSLDLSPLDYFLWGYLKSRVFAKKLRTITELKESTRDEARAIPKSMFRDVTKNFVKKGCKCAWTIMGVMSSNACSAEGKWWIALFSFPTVLELFNKDFATNFSSFEYKMEKLQLSKNGDGFFESPGTVSLMALTCSSIKVWNYSLNSEPGWWSKLNI